MIEMFLPPLVAAAISLVNLMKAKAELRKAQDIALATKITATRIIVPPPQQIITEDIDCEVVETKMIENAK